MTLPWHKKRLLWYLRLWSTNDPNQVCKCVGMLDMCSPGTRLSSALYSRLSSIVMFGCVGYINIIYWFNLLIWIRAIQRWKVTYCAFNISRLLITWMNTSFVYNSEGQIFSAGWMCINSDNDYKNMYSFVYSTVELCRGQVVWRMDRWLFLTILPQQNKRQFPVLQYMMTKWFW